MRKSVYPKTDFQKWFFDNLIENDLTMSDVASKLHTSRQTVSNHYRNSKSVSYCDIIGYCIVFKTGNLEEVYKMAKSPSYLAKNAIY